jgi:cytoskeletal protein RodZ
MISFVPSFIKFNVLFYFILLFYGKHNVTFVQFIKPERKETCETSEEDRNEILSSSSESSVEIEEEKEKEKEKEKEDSFVSVESAMEPDEEFVFLLFSCYFIFFFLHSCFSFFLFSFEG